MYVCPVCDKECNGAMSMRRHLTKAHKADNYSIKRFFKPCFYSEFICPLCQKDHASRQDLKQHLTNVHDINFEEQSLTFTSEEEFLKWKKEMEIQTCSLYTKKSGSRMRKDGTKVCSFHCQRSGKFINHSKGIRQVATTKLNAYCPSEIYVCVKNGIYYIKFVKTHVGHSCDFSNLSLRASRLINIDQNFTFVCPICRDSFKSKQTFHFHLINDHNVSLNPEKFNFLSEEEFKTWKMNVEEISSLKFTTRGKKLVRDDGYTYKERFVCHLSKLEYQRKKFNKTERKCKSFRMDVSCPAEIKVDVQNGEFSVNFISLHIGHSIDDENEINCKMAFVCPPCPNAVLPSSEHYHDHLSKFHNIVVEVQNINFLTEELFNNWKTNAEIIGNCQFIKKRKSLVIPTRDYIQSHFYCEQNNLIFIDESMNESEKKSVVQLCPAEIVMCKERGTINVRYVKTHIGHSFELDKNIIIESVTTDDNFYNDDFLNNSPVLSPTNETISAAKGIEIIYQSDQIQSNIVLKSVTQQPTSLYNQNLTKAQTKMHMCPKCKASGFTKQQLCDHLFLEHDIKLETESLTFTSEAEFNLWKLAMEKLTHSSYALKDSRYNDDGKTELINYRCDTKCKNSKKDGLHCCPSEIIVQKCENAFTVEFIRTHVGHASVSADFQITDVKSLGELEEIGINLTKENGIIRTEEVKTTRKYFILVARGPE